MRVLERVFGEFGYGKKVHRLLRSAHAMRNEDQPANTLAFHSPITSLTLSGRIT